MALIGKLFGGEFSRPGAEYELAPNLADNATSAWVRVSGDEPAYLFVMLGGGYCGSGGCLIYAFRKTKRGRAKVYAKFAADGIEVLDTSTKGHRDLRRYEDFASAGTFEIISRWNGSAYSPARRLSRPCQRPSAWQHAHVARTIAADRHHAGAMVGAEFVGN